MTSYCLRPAFSTPPSTTSSSNPTMLTLPNELLTKIFSYADLREPDADLREPDDTDRLPIQRIRLVCRRFADVGARVLIPCLRVEYTYRSVTRLEAVSRHPLIRAGVRDVDLRTDMYNYEFARNPRLYAEMKLCEFDAYDAIARERGFLVRDATTLAYKGQDAVALHNFETVCCLAIGDHPVGRRLVTQYQALLEGFSLYRRRMNDQMKLYENFGTPEDRIASALTQFGGLRGLRFNSHLYRRFPWTACESLGDLLQAQSNPSFWELPGVTYIQEQHRMAFFSLFNALARQDVMIRGLELGLFCASDFSLAADADGPMHGVRKVCRDLRHLSFNGVAPDTTPDCFPDALCWPTEPEAIAETNSSLRNLFRALTHASDRVESITINPFPMGHPMAQASMMTWLNRRSWKSLQSLKMYNCAIDGQDFVRFYKALRKPVNLTMRTVHMTEGTWRDVLRTIDWDFADCIRDTSGCDHEELQGELEDGRHKELEIEMVTPPYALKWVP